MRHRGIAAVFVFCSALWAQGPVALTARSRPASNRLPPSIFRVDTRMVQIPVTVTDQFDRSVMNLTAKDFRVLEGGVEQQITAFSMSDAPISAGIVFDTSGSMKKRMDESRAAVRQFLESAVTGDEYSLVRFSDAATLVEPFTSEAPVISRQLGSLSPGGWTALYDAVFLSIQQMRRAANPRRVLLILSDGDDNNSRYTESELISLVREADVRVYSIGLFTRAHCLERMARETGGRTVTVHNLSELPATMAKLSEEIRNLYMLGYIPANPANDGRYRKVTVEVHAAAPLRVSWRRGYVGPER